MGIRIECFGGPQDGLIRDFGASVDDIDLELIPFGRNCGEAAIYKKTPKGMEFIRIMPRKERQKLKFDKFGRLEL